MILSHNLRTRAHCASSGLTIHSITRPIEETSQLWTKWAFSVKIFLLEMSRHKLFSETESIVSKFLEQKQVLRALIREEWANTSCYAAERARLVVYEIQFMTTVTVEVTVNQQVKKMSPHSDLINCSTFALIF